MTSTLVASAAGSGQLWRSEDQGTSFSTLSGMPTIYDADFINGRWMAATDTYSTDDDGVWGYVPIQYSVDDGLTWHLMHVAHQVDAAGSPTPGYTDDDPHQISGGRAVRSNGQYWLLGGVKAYPAPSNSPCIAKSYDGVEWTTVDAPALYGTAPGLDAATTCWWIVWSGSIWIGKFSLRSGEYFLASSTDGETWTRSSYPDGHTDASNLHYPMRVGNDIVFAGYRPPDYYAEIYRTSDGGQTWTINLVSNYSTDPVFLDYSPELGVLLSGWMTSGPSGHEVQIARSVDQGQSWTIASSPVGWGQGYYDGKLCIWDGEKFYLGGRDFATSGGGSSRFASSSDGITWAVSTASAQEFAVLTSTTRPDFRPIVKFLDAGIRKPPSQRNPEFSVARQKRAIESMAPGSLGGRVTNAARTGTVIVAGPGTTKTSDGTAFITFRSDAARAVTVGDSGPYRAVGKQILASRVTLTLAVAGSSTTTVVVKKNGAGFATLNAPAGATSVDVSSAVAIGQGDVVYASVTAAGTGATGLTVQVKTH